MSYPMEPTTVLKMLPLAPRKLVGLIKVIFLSHNRVTRADATRLRFYIVRRHKVVRALQWLIRHNPHYHDVQLDQDCISQLPIDGIPMEVYEHLTFSDQIEADAAGHSRYDAPDLGPESL